jgi:threonine-phosphate decarboxylase
MVARVVNVELPVHGGDAARIEERYGVGPWLDFSANIAPGSPPPAALEALRRGASDIASLIAYPTAHDRALRTALARAAGLDEDRIVIANGAAALIEAFVRTVAPRRALVPQPAFSEYARALAAAGCEVVPLPLAPHDAFGLDVDRVVAALDRDRPDAAIVTNPHNPSGAAASREAMLAIADAANARGIALLIDEAFVDYAPERSVTEAVHAGNVFVLRSLTKFYAMPGLRVGYGVATPAFARAIAARIPSWPVTSLAADAARAAIGDDGYARATRSANTVERTALSAGLRELALPVFESSANFVLFATPLRSPQLAERLAAAHRIIVRDCDSYAGLSSGGYIRASVRARDENERLVAALRSVLSDRA